MKIVHVITGLQTGGAEMMLWKLVSSSSPHEFEHVVISLTGGGPIAERLNAAGARVLELNFLPAGRSPVAFLALVRLLRKEKPDVVQTWLYHGDLFGGIAARLGGIRRVIWNIRASRLTARSVGRGTMALVHVCAWLSRVIPRAIVCCSEASVATHRRLGYDAGRMCMIPNGFDLDRFQPDAAARASLRAELGVTAGTILIGLIGRFDPLKDHATFVHAAGLVRERRPDVHFVLCGKDISLENEQLAIWIAAAALGNSIHLLGQRDDIPRLNAAFDVATCSSSSEGFPNVVGEAMACGVPCVVTDAGDCGLIVGDTGIVVPPANAELFADALLRMIGAGAEGRRELGAQARLRVKNEFELGRITRRYENLYTEIALEERR